MVGALGGALPHLRINHLSMFSGLTIPDADLLMLLAHNLRHVLAGQLTAEDCRRLDITAVEAKTPGGGAKPPIPHASDPTVAAALRQLGWLVERHGDAVGTLWEVEVGRRVWLACWLLRLSALPAAATAAWSTPARFTPKPGRPSWLDAASPLARATGRAAAAGGDAAEQEESATDEDGGPEVDEEAVPELVTSDPMSDPAEEYERYDIHHGPQSDL
jgi:hypothetical protein